MMPFLQKTGSPQCAEQPNIRIVLKEITIFSMKQLSIMYQKFLLNDNQKETYLTVGWFKKNNNRPRAVVSI